MIRIARTDLFFFRFAFVHLRDLHIFFFFDGHSLSKMSEVSGPLRQGCVPTKLATGRVSTGVPTAATCRADLPRGIKLSGSVQL